MENVRDLDLIVRLPIKAVGWELTLGPIDDSKLDLSEFSCTSLPNSPLQNCSFYFGGGPRKNTITLIHQNRFIERFTVILFDVDQINQAKEGINPPMDSFDRKKDLEPGLMQSEFVGDNETVQILESQFEPRPYGDSLTITAFIKKI